MKATLSLEERSIICELKTTLPIVFLAFLITALNASAQLQYESELDKIDFSMKRAFLIGSLGYQSAIPLDFDSNVGYRYHLQNDRLVNRLKEWVETRDSIFHTQVFTDDQKCELLFSNTYVDLANPSNQEHERTDIYLIVRGSTTYKEHWVVEINLGLSSIEWWGMDFYFTFDQDGSLVSEVVHPFVN